MPILNTLARGSRDLRPRVAGYLPKKNGKTLGKKGKALGKNGKALGKNGESQKPFPMHKNCQHPTGVECWQCTSEKRSKKRGLTTVVLVGSRDCSYWHSV